MSPSERLSRGSRASQVQLPDPGSGRASVYGTLQAEAQRVGPAFAPRLAPLLHLPHPKPAGWRRSRRCCTRLEPLRGLHTHLLAGPLPFRGQPATLRVPQCDGIPGEQGMSRASDSTSGPVSARDAFPADSRCGRCRAAGCALCATPRKRPSLTREAQVTDDGTGPPGILPRPAGTFTHCSSGA